MSEEVSVAYRPGLPRGVSFGDAAAFAAAIRPTGLVHGRTAERAVAGGFAFTLAGGRLAFTSCELVVPTPAGVDLYSADARALRDWVATGDGAGAARALDRLTLPRPPFAGLALNRPRIMGIVNVTPDSFSDGGRFLDPDAAARHGLALMEAGCDIVDVGGESTRPGAGAVAESEEIRRVLPVVRALAGRGVPVSIDTRRAGVMRAAIDGGAAIVNDVTALTADAESLAIAAAAEVSVVLMHMQGEPATMQQRPVYRHAPSEILAYLRSRVGACVSAGIPLSRLAVDPGVGFGKTAAHNAQLLGEAAIFHGIGCAVAVGVSRKSFIARLSRGEPAADRLPGTIAGLVAAAGQGVQIHRVHDAAEARQALAILGAIMAG